MAMTIAQYPLNLSQYGPYLELDFGASPSVAGLSKKDLKTLADAEKDESKKRQIIEENEKKQAGSGYVFGLYIPEDFVSNFNINWEATQILGLAGLGQAVMDIAKGGGNIGNANQQAANHLKSSLASVGAQAFAPTLIETFTGSSSFAKKAWGELEYSQGFAFNPKERLKFDGADFFQLDLNWDFLPQSKEEAENVEIIVSSLQNLALPGEKWGEDWLAAPQVCSIRFIEGGDGEDGQPIAAISDNAGQKGNTAANFLLKYARKMAITNITVKLLNENSSIFYKNGSAIGYNVNCTFKSVFKAIKGVEGNQDSILHQSLSDPNYKKV